jgi:hypothetical protein
LIVITENELAKLATIELPQGEPILIKTSKKPSPISAARLQVKAAVIINKRRLGYGIPMVISDRALRVKKKDSD